MTPYCDHAVPMAIQCKQCDAEELEKLRSDLARLQAENEALRGALEFILSWEDVQGLSEHTGLSIVCHAALRGEDFIKALYPSKTLSQDNAPSPTPPSDPKGGTE